MSDENNNLNVEDLVETPQQQEETPEPRGFNEEEIIEIEWEQVEDLFHNKQALKQTEQFLSRMVLDYEKKKMQLLGRIQNLESMMYEKASALRDELSVSPELTYELKLPQSEGEKSYFIRKDFQE